MNHQAEPEADGGDDKVAAAPGAAAAGTGEAGAGEAGVAGGGPGDTGAEEAIAADAAAAEGTSAPDTVAAAQASAPARPETGEPRVDAALTLLDRLDELPVTEHAAVFEQVHAELSAVLGQLDPESAGTDG